MADAVTETLRPLPEGIVCPLSGGRDSRMLFVALARDGRVETALTVSDDEGDTYEEDLAARVAEEFGVRHEVDAGDPERYREDWEERARRVEHEFVDHAWLMPAIRRFDGGEKPVPDGFAIDVLLGRYFHTEDTLGPGAGNRSVFQALRKVGHGELALAPRFRAPLVDAAEAGFLRASRRFEASPARIALAIYANRSLRGVSTYSTRLIGDGARVLTPGASDEFVRASLSIDPREKIAENLHPEVIETLAPRAAGLPSTAEVPRRPPRLPRRWRSGPARATYLDLLADGPLAAHVVPELTSWLERPRGELRHDLRLGMEAICLLHSWCRRHAELIRTPDPADLLG
jgi:asparagine synthetase B (glutamine-hydrolysing)